MNAKVKKPMTRLDAINRLLQVERQGTGASQAAANVLLSAYNVHSFKLDLGELTTLDAENFLAAQIVISLRCWHGIEPHTLIQNGESIFQDLAERWENIRVAA